MASPYSLPVSHLIEWANISEENGPFHLQLDGHDGPADSIACDASLRPNGIASWAAVRGDGAALVGWYHARESSTEAAEMRAILAGVTYFTKGTVTIFTDSAGAVDLIRWLEGQEFPAARTLSTVLHPQHSAPFRIPLQRRGIELVGLHGDHRDGPSRNCAPEHPGLRAAHHLAWTLGRIVSDGFPLDADAMEFLRSSASYNKSARKKNAWRRYKVWKERKLSPNAFAHIPKTDARRIAALDHPISADRRNITSPTEAVSDETSRHRQPHSARTGRKR